MTRRPGRPLRSAPRPPESNSWVVNVVVSVGVVVSLGLVVVAAVLNFRMGYRSADTDLDGLIYGAGAGCGDALKAIAPFMGFWGWRRKDWVAVAAAVLLFTVFTAYSFTAALGFAAQHRANKEAAALRGIEQHADLRGEMDRAVARVKDMGSQRSAAEVEQSVVIAYRQTVGYGNKTVADVSQGCTLNRLATRTACQAIAKLGEELARAKEAESLDAKITTLRASLDQQANGATAASADPQVDAIKRAADILTNKVGKDDIGYALSFLLAAFIELGSGLGLYVVTTPWRSKASLLVQPPPPSPSKEEGRGLVPVKALAGEVLDPSGRALGLVDSYAMERLEPDDSGELLIGEMFEDYVTWCRWRGELPFSRTEFGRQFGALAKFLGMRRVQRDRVEVYLDVRLIEVLPKLPSNRT